MREDIKKKFLDILFEPDEVDRSERIVAKAPLEDIKPKRPVTVKKEEVKVKPQTEVKKTAFINIDNPKVEDKDLEVAQIKEKVNNKDYEFTQNISPIFGVVDGPKKASEPKVITDDSQTSKPSSSYLGTVISPIFGYDANKSTETFENYKEEMDGLKGEDGSSKENVEPFDDTLSLNKSDIEVELSQEELGEVISEEEHYEEIDDVVNIEQEDEYYSDEDEELFKELSISDIFKTEDEVKEDKKEERVTYTSLFDNKED